MFTNRAKALGVTAIAVVVVGGLSYGQYVTTKQVANLTANQTPVVVSKIVVVTPTTVPTATPAAGLKYTPVTRIGTPASVTKGVAK